MSFIMPPIITFYFSILINPFDNGAHTDCGETKTSYSCIAYTNIAKISTSGLYYFFSLVKIHI